jgi:hypothetical protein
MEFSCYRFDLVTFEVADNILLEHTYVIPLGLENKEKRQKGQTWYKQKTKPSAETRIERSARNTFLFIFLSLNSIRIGKQLLVFFSSIPTLIFLRIESRFVWFFIENVLLRIHKIRNSIDIKRIFFHTQDRLPFIRNNLNI